MGLRGFAVNAPRPQQESVSHAVVVVSVALHRSVATHAEAPRLYTDLQTQGSAYRPVSTPLAEATRSRTNPHVLGALHRSEAAGSFTELQTRGSSYTPVSTPLAGATWPHTEPHVLGGLCRPASTHAEVASFTELQPLVRQSIPVASFMLRFIVQAGIHISDWS
ncbi:uncharacterized protein [Dermacentor albipictus]|uniref:uncharacterized protein n=1 Tax=Dermacentor albipictus TaxID=60249 RepID=UPI0038FCD975